MNGDADFAVGDTVRIKTGAFSAFTGRIETIDKESGTLKVTVTVFGRSTPVELTFDGVEKIEFTNTDLTNDDNSTNHN